MVLRHHQQPREEVQRDEKSEEVDSTVGKSYPFLFVAGLAIGTILGENLIGGAIGVTVGLAVGGVCHPSRVVLARRRHGRRGQ